jgi:DNA-binding transcriptional ArsR family regulator
MTEDPNFAYVGALIGEPARAAMLAVLLGGRAMAASELAYCAGISPQTASTHLARLVEGGLLGVTTSGRHRYYRLAGPQVAHVLETMSAIAPSTRIRSLRQSDEAYAVRFARTCYDHLAGVVGVALTERMLERGLIVQTGHGEPGEHTYRIGEEGINWLHRHGLDADRVLHSRRAQARACLDWSERRDHLAGALGATVTEWMLEQGWIARIAGSRAVRLTEAGRDGFLDEWELQFDDRPEEKINLAIS